ncbi:hypothetical protein [Streptomyces xanthochromogenes]|uniref:Integral membrane protein n=1 Tax=Streptomyces xanthochromogenes TaxID=67384 RepID=A0ABQ3A6Z9_9ACTN|nr:hypothetical protein [Streptomyces xanthochromogenes]GGY39037.1 hypothetical protein GCM10010326_36390 [Streptomyces xanthochromogenes]
MPASNAALTVWQDVTPRPRAERRGAQAVANVRRAAHIHAFGVDGTDWALMARVYQRAVGAAGWWRLGAACAVLPVGLAAQLAALHVLARYGQDVPLAALPFASGPLGVVEGLLFALLVAVVWCAVMFGPAFLICQGVKRVARKPPAWTERPVPPALAVAETCGELLTVPGDERAGLMKRLDAQLEVLLADLWRATGNGMGMTRHSAHRKALTRHLRRVEAALRETQGSLFSDVAAARTLGRQSLTIATRLATPQVMRLLDEQDLPPETGDDRREGRRLAAVTTLGLAASSVVVHALLQLHILPEALAPWIFGAAFVSVFLAAFGQRSSARPLAVLRQRLAALGTVSEPTEPSASADGEGRGPHAQG